MSFEINGVEWTPEENINKEWLLGLVHVGTDRELVSKTLAETGIEGTAAHPFDRPFEACESFKNGRIVVASMLDLQKLGEAAPGEDESSCWFSAADRVVQIRRQKVQGCYGGLFERGVARVFGGLMLRS